MSQILDSGERREFNTGAVRDISDGKGRCDLLPLDIISDFFEEPICEILNYISNFVYEGDPDDIKRAISLFVEKYYSTLGEAMLELSKHYEAGCQKYGDRNWERGIPLHCYIDSAVRHLIKFESGWNDEPHDRAFLWNLFGALWTMKHKPNLNDLPCSGK